MANDPVVSKCSELMRLGLMPTVQEIKDGKVCLIRTYAPAVELILLESSGCVTWKMNVRIFGLDLCNNLHAEIGGWNRRTHLCRVDTGLSEKCGCTVVIIRMTKCILYE
jgi:hypothetical protein